MWINVDQKHLPNKRPSLLKLRIWKVLNAIGFLISTFILSGVILYFFWS